jgi:hypothetical protein
MNHALYTKHYKEVLRQRQIKDSAYCVQGYPKNADANSVRKFVAQMRCQSEMTILNDAGLIIATELTYTTVQAAGQHFKQATHL